MADAVGVVIVVILGLFGLMIMLAGAAILFVIVYAAIAPIIAGIVSAFQKN